MSIQQDTVGFPATQRDIMGELQQAINAGQPIALATVVDVQGASPARPGFKLLARADGSWLGNVGGMVISCLSI